MAVVLAKGNPKLNFLNKMLAQTEKGFPNPVVSKVSWNLN